MEFSNKMQNSVAKKIFAVGSAVVMTLAMSAPLLAHAAVHAAGTNVVDSSGTVWMVMPDGTRRAYTSAGAFLSYGFNSWAQVVPASAEDLALPQGSFIPPQDGSIICSDRNDSFAVKGTCYEISNGQKFGFTSAAVFTGLGFSFTNSSTADVSWMTAGSQLLNNTTAAHLPGTLVNNKGTVQLVGNSGLLGIPDVATFNSWGYSFGKVVPANAADQAMTQTGVMAARVAGQLSPTALVACTVNCTTTPPVTVGPISVGLSSANPGPGTLVQGQVAATLAVYNLTGTGTVTGLTLQKLGVSSNNLLQNVYLYNGATRLTDAASVNSSGQITFANGTNLFAVNGSMTLSVLADIVCSGSSPCESDSGQTVGVQLTAIQLAGNMVASGVPISGNLMSVVSAPNVATVSVTNVTPSTSTCQSGTPCFINPESGLVAWQATFNVSGQNAVNFSRMSLREIGSIDYSNISGLSLLVDGVQVAQASGLDSNGYATFAISPVKTLSTGAHTVQVLANVTGGAGRTLSFTLQNQADIGLVDTTYNVGIAALPGSATSFSQIAAGTYEVNAITSGGGSFTVQPTNVVTTTNVSPNTTNADLGDWIVTTYGEPIKISTLTVGVLVNGIASTTSQLRNGVIEIGTSPTSLGQYGSTQSVPSTAQNAATAQYQVNYTVQPGTPVYVEFRADVYNNSTASGAYQFGNGVTIQPFLDTGVNNAQGTVSDIVAALPGSSTLSATAMTVSTGTVSVVANGTYSNQNTVAPQTQYHLASFYVNGTSIEDANISGITVGFGNSTAAGMLNNVKVYWNGVPENTVKSTVGATGNLYSVYHTLAMNTNALIDIYGDINQTNTGSIKTSVEVTGTTVLSGQQIDVNDGGTGQTIVVGTTGTLVASQDSANTPIASLVAGGQKQFPVASFKFSATNDTFKLTDLNFTLGTGANSVASTLYVVNHTTGTVLAQQSVGSGVGIALSGMSIPISGNVTLDIKLDLGTVGTGAGTAGSDVKVTLNSYKVNGSNGAPHSSVSSGFTLGSVHAGNDIYVYNAVPTVASAGGSGTLSTGQQTLYTFTVSGTNVTWDKVAFNIATSSVSVAASSLGVYNSANQLVTTVSTGCATFDTNSNTLCTASSEQPTGTFTLKGTVTGTLSNASVSTYIPEVSSSQSNNTAASQTGSFVWSDNSASAHDLTTSTDWFNDYLVPNLPTNPFSLNHT